MFREKLHNDLDRISPDEKLLSEISQMMAEEAKRPRTPIYMTAVKYAGMAAAICLVAIGAVSFFGKGNDISTETAAPDTAMVAEAPSADSLARAIDMADAGNHEAVPMSISEDEAAASVTVTAYSNENRVIFPENISAEIFELMADFFTENPHSLIDIDLTREEMEMYTAKGLYIRIETAAGSEWLVLIDDSSSFAVNNGEIFRFDEGYKERLMAYFE